MGQACLRLLSLGREAGVEEMDLHLFLKHNYYLGGRPTKACRCQ